jgi:hypothetical protein
LLLLFKDRTRLKSRFIEPEKLSLGGCHVPIEDIIVQRQRIALASRLVAEELCFFI